MKKFFLFLIVFIPVLCSANFIGMNWGARALSMGNAYVAFADDPTAIFWNPARLPKIEQFTLTASHQNMYGISDFNNDMLAFSVPLPYSRVGLGLTQISLTDVYTERVVFIGGASVLWIKNIPLYFGLNLKFLQANVKNYDDADSPQQFDFDFGINTEYKSVSLAFVTRNITEAEFEFIDHADNIEREYVTGLAYHWKKVVNFSCDYLIKNDGNSFNFGGEMWFFNVFAPRIGMNGDKFTAGFGLKSKFWKLDGAVLSHEALGSTYRLSLILNFDLF